MLFSVVIPTFNRASLLGRTLESVWSQRFTDFEVIIVDDGSTDGTVDFLYQRGWPVQLIMQSNLGGGAARNVGACRARGDYLAFLDSDDWWFPWTLACFAELIERHNGPAILSARLVEFSDESELAVVKQESTQAATFADYFASHHTGYFVGAGMSVLKRVAFLNTSGYTDRDVNSEDHDLILRLGNLPGFVQVLKPVTLGWRRHPGSATRDLRRSAQGSRFLVDQELHGAYPGGSDQLRARRDIIARHTRAIALACLRQGLRREAWALYRETFAWNVALGRFKYLVAFPMLSAVPATRQG
jgi:glycosyltransferase involved in cell wall biosynthesis